MLHIEESLNCRGIPVSFLCDTRIYVWELKYYIARGQLHLQLGKKKNTFIVQHIIMDYLRTAR